MSWYLPDGDPLFWHEARRLLRGKRAFVVMLAYGVALIIVLVASSYFIGEIRDPTGKSLPGKCSIASSSSGNCC